MTGLKAEIDTRNKPFYGKTYELLICTCLRQTNVGTIHFFHISSNDVIPGQPQIKMLHAHLGKPIQMSSTNGIRVEWGINDVQTLKGMSGSNRNTERC